MVYTEINDSHKDASLLGRCEDHQRMQESSLDEMTSYSKYEKEELELKGPIENFPQCLLFQAMYIPLTTQSQQRKLLKTIEFVIRQLVRTRVISVSDIGDCPKFDLILLGMGPYGNVASLFPNHSVLDEKEEWVTFLTDSLKPLQRGLLSLC